MKIQTPEAQLKRGYSMSRVTAPEAFFGYQLGSDKHIARWDKIVEYYYKLETESDRIKVFELGKTTEGNPFLLTVISSPENLQKLEHYRKVNLQIQDPRGLSEDQVKALIGEGKAIICQSMSLHANEIGGTQMAPELAYDLITKETAENKAILDNVIFLMVPCFNPDGEIMVVDWYNKYIGTEYEGCTMPWLYHKYTGHDNNRDAFMQNIPESRLMGKVLFRDWIPQAYQDHHHMGPYGPRLFVSPYSDPIRPYADPLIWRELSWYGAHMAYKLEEGGKTGVINAAQFGGWGHFGFHWITPFHNIAGMLTESASAKLATPMYIHPSQFEGASPKTNPVYEPQTNFPHPWEGGWWRLRDICEQQYISAWAILDIAARFKDTLLWNSYQKASRQTERGEAGSPSAYLISPCQHDPLEVTKLVQLLLNQGIEIKVSRKEFDVCGVTYPAGTYVVFLAQPKMGVIRNLLGRTLYPDGYWTRNPDGSPIVFDMCSDTVAEYMGVDVLAVDCCISGDFETVTSVAPEVCEVAPAKAGYVMDARANDAFLVVNRLFKGGAKVWRLDEPFAVGCCSLPAGAFYVQACCDKVHAAVKALATTGVGFYPVDEAPAVKMHMTGNLRVGMYQRYWGGNADEGWTRFIFDQFEFPYVTLYDKDIREGDLIDKVDVLIMPADRKQLIHDITKLDRNDPVVQQFFRYQTSVVPPEYKSGLGDEGTRKIKEFVEAGGRVVAFCGASNYVIDALSLKVRNVIAGKDHKFFYCNGSTLHAKVDVSNPLAYGMPEEALVFNLGSPTFEIYEAFNAQDYTVVAEYPERDLLQSGWLIGEDKIAGKPCMVSVKVKKGEAVLIGFRTQHRAQTHGTFKFLFNCLVK
jgi:hypothetical protein